VPSRIATKVPHLHQAVAAGELGVLQVLRQVGVLHRAEERRMQAHEEDADSTERRAVGQEPDCGDHHHHDLEVLHEAHQAGALELVGELARGGREEQERRDEDRADHEARGGAVAAAPAAPLVGGEQREGELEQVVVRGAEELRPEERREAALGEECELAVAGHIRRAP
jgi:hypothetical protein